MNKKIYLKNYLIDIKINFFHENKSKTFPNNEIFKILKNNIQGSIYFTLGFSKSNIIKNKKEYIQLINDWIGNKEQKWTLLYDYKIDKFSANTFHKKCDFKPGTLTLIQSKNGENIFGGFLSKVFGHNTRSTFDDQSFLFSLNKLKFKIKRKDSAAYSYKGCFPFYASDCDLFVIDKCDVGNNCCNPCYYDIKNSSDLIGKNNKHPKGENYFYVDKIEIYCKK
jgi:hypothetical protein